MGASLPQYASVLLGENAGTIATIENMTEKLYQALGRRTITKYLSFSAWMLGNMQIFRNATWQSLGCVFNADHILCTEANSSSTHNALVTAKKYDLENATTVSFDIECTVSGANMCVFASSNQAENPTKLTSLALPVGARSWLDMPVSAVNAKAFLGVYVDTSITGAQSFKLYGIRIDGVAIPTLGAFVEVSGDVSLPTGDTARKMYSPLIVGTYNWDTLQVIKDLNAGAVTVNVLDEAHNVLKTNVADLSDLSDLIVDRVILEVELTRPLAGDLSPKLKELWIAYL